MIEKFTFYRNYYEIIKYLPDKDKLKLYNAILEYMFENKEPELKELLKGIWINIKMPLDTNKKNIKNGQNGGRPIKPNDNPNNNPKETQEEPKGKPKAKANNISIFLFLISNNKYKYIYNNSSIYKELELWFNYKQEKKEYYKETGMQSLLKQVEKHIEVYGERTVIDLIENCMANNYKGIIFDKLKDKPKQKKEEIIPHWLYMTDEELKNGGKK